MFLFEATGELADLGDFGPPVGAVAAVFGAGAGSLALAPTNFAFLAEEVDHARAGWAHLATPSLPAGQRAAVERRLPEFVRAAVEDWLAAGEDLPVGTGLADHGVLSAAEHRAVILRAVRDVVVPGFARVGLLRVDALRRW